MKKILFLLGMYYPYYSANGLCVKNVADELVKQGYSTTCICNGYKNCENENIENVDVYYIKPKLSQKFFYKSKETKNPKKRKFLNRMSCFLSKTGLALHVFSWPYTNKIYMKRFYKKAKELYLKKEFDIVVSVYTPFEALYAGYKLKKEFPSIKFVPYYLDALAGGWGPSFFSKRSIIKAQTKWDNIINKEADIAISMQSVKNLYDNSNSLITDNRYYLDVPVMLPPYKLQSTITTDNYAVYAGTLKKTIRDLSSILQIFNEINKKIEFDLYLIGQCDDIYYYEKFINNSNGHIIFLGQKLHNDVIEYERNASFLINLGNTNKNTLPSKIFEYMRFNKPIISTYSIEDEPSITYLKKYKDCLFINENDDCEQNAKKIIEFMKKPRTEENINYEKVFYNNTPKAFVDLINKLNG